MTAVSGERWAVSCETGCEWCAVRSRAGGARLELGADLRVHRLAFGPLLRVHRLLGGVELRVERFGFEDSLARGFEVLLLPRVPHLEVVEWQRKQIAQSCAPELRQAFRTFSHSASSSRCTRLPSMRSFFSCSCVAAISARRARSSSTRARCTACRASSSAAYRSFPAESWLRTRFAVLSLCTCVCSRL